MAASQYAGIADIASTGLPTAALDGILDADKNKFLSQASALVESYMRGRYRLPLTGVLGPPNTYPAEIVAAVVAIGTWELLVFRGLNPDEFDSVYRERKQFYLGDPVHVGPAARGWLDKLAAGTVSIGAASDATPGVSEGAPRVSTGVGRGWRDEDWNGSSDE